MSKPDIDPDDTKAEWKLFRYLVFVQHRKDNVLLKLHQGDILAASQTFKTS